MEGKMEQKKKFIKRFSKNKGAVAGLFVFILLVFIALFEPRGAEFFKSLRH